ncbi:MAG: HTH domain-containing protein, partial [Clostridia bacterium]|nr:HTH domain-containing protein [Clostridia bacterium]
MKSGYIKNKVLAEICSGKVVSGGLIASKLGISRTAVWKAVNSLRAEGYFITGLGGGYVLSPENTRLCGEQLSATVGGGIIFKDETESTNEDIKRIAESGGEEFTAV